MTEIDEIFYMSPPLSEADLKNIRSVPNITKQFLFVSSAMLTCVVSYSAYEASLTTTKCVRDSFSAA